MNPQQSNTQPVTLILTSCRTNGQKDRTRRTVQFVMNTDAFQVVDTTTGTVVYQNAYNAVKLWAAGTGKRPVLQALGGTPSTRDMLLFELLPDASAATRKAAWLQLVNDLRQHNMTVASRVDNRSYWEQSVERAERTFPVLFLVAIVPVAGPAIGYGAAVFWGVVLGALIIGICEVIKHFMRKRATVKS